jgi:hypothetical protein
MVKGGRIVAAAVLAALLAGGCLVITKDPVFKPGGPGYLHGGKETGRPAR